jgi:antitoxin YefM
MKTLPLSEVKMKLSALIDHVENTDEEVIITKNGRPAAVLLSHCELESLKETIAVKSDAELVADIRKGVAELKAKRAKLYTLEEVLDDSIL